MTEPTKLYLGRAADCPAEHVESFLRALALFVDTETTGLSPYRDRLALIQIHDRATNCTALLQPGYDVPWLRELFQRRDCTFIGHNVAMFDMQFLANQFGLGIFDLRWFDTLIAESLVSTSGRRDVSVSLRASVRRRVGLDLDKAVQHGAWDSSVLTADQVRYAVQDVLALVELYDAQLLKAAEQKAQPALALEMNVAPVLGRMSWNGIFLPQENFFQYVRKQETAAGAAEQLLNATLGKLNYNSPKQVVSALHRVGIPLTSTNHNILVDYIALHPDNPKTAVVQALVDYRAPKKRASMYSLDWYMEHCTNGKVHPLFWSIGADTLRMSSSKPNLQQIPRDARGMFGNVNGLSVVSVDYSQLEIRVAAALSKDEALLEVLDHDDVHTAIAAQIFHCAPEEVTPNQRKAAKAASFVLLFGGSARTLHDYSRRMGGGMSPEQAEAVFQQFFAAFKGIRATRMKAYEATRDRSALVIKLPGGARRTLVGEKLSPQVVLNTTVQGTAAIGLKHALAECKRRGLETFLSAAIHDEIVSTVPSPYASAYAAELSDAMIAGMGQVVPCKIKVEAKHGPNWQ